jgi:hypothetical protein
MSRISSPKFILVLAASFLAGCETPSPAPERTDALNYRLLRQLLDSNALDPVDEAEFSEQDSYAELEKTYADRPRTRDVLENAERAALEPAEPEAGSQTTPGVSPAKPATPVNPYLEFGSDIVPYDDDGDGVHDRIMKPYAFPLGFGERVVNLMRIYGDFDVWVELANGAPQPEGAQPVDSVVLDLHASSMTEVWSDPRAPALTEGKPISLFPSPEPTRYQRGGGSALVTIRRTP